jgi:hypothetical protein
MSRTAASRYDLTVQGHVKDIEKHVPLALPYFLSRLLGLGLGLAAGAGGWGWRLGLGAGAGGWGWRLGLRAGRRAQGAGRRAQGAGRRAQGAGAVSKGGSSYQLWLTLWGSMPTT